MREERQCIMHDADHKGIVADQACMASHLFHSCGDTKISVFFFISNIGEKGKRIKVDHVHS
jgi:hypothetical protein